MNALCGIRDGVQAGLGNLFTALLAPAITAVFDPLDGRGERAGAIHRRDAGGGTWRLRGVADAGGRDRGSDPGETTTAPGGP